jgi:hypothetical protein
MISQDVLFEQTDIVSGRQTALPTFVHIAVAMVFAIVVYLSISLFAFQFMSEGNGVIGGKLVPNDDHWPVAQELMAGTGLTKFSYAPGFSVYIVAAVQAAERWGGSYYLWRLVQDCLSTGITAVLLMKLMQRLTSSRLAGWGAILAFLYNLTYSAGTSADLAMASFMPWFSGGLLLLVDGLQKRLKKTTGGGFSALLAGILLSLSGFIRPDILLFIPFLATIWFLIRSFARFRPSAQFVCTGRKPERFVFAMAAGGFCLVLLPWIIYASVRAGTVVIYSTGFVRSHIDGMIRFPSNSASETFLRNWPQMYRPHIRQTQVPRETNLLVAKPMSLSEVLRVHFYVVQTYPVDYARLWAEKLWRPWYASDSRRWNLLLGVQSMLILVLFVPGVYLWLCRRGLDLNFSIAIGVISYFWLVALAVVSINRYMPPVYPFLGMFIGYGAHVLWLERRKFSHHGFSTSERETRRP